MTFSIKYSLSTSYASSRALIQGSREFKEGCNFYSGVHIDSTIVPLREGLVMLNASRVTPNTCPRAFDRWDKIWVEDVVAQGFYQYPYASKWIAMNMLTVDPNTVIVDRHQTELFKH